jgi:septal ring factor EnvC (AmiA/AmiB activator)
VGTKFDIYVFIAAHGEKATITMEVLLDDKNRNLEQTKSRVHDLEGKLNKKKEKLETVHDQQLRALEDIKKLKEKNNHKETEIKILEVKTTEMEKEINQLKQTIDYLQKQITLKDMALKRAVDEKGKIVAEHTKTLQNVERKQDLTLKTCEKMADSLKNLTATVGSLRWDIQGQQQQQQGPAVPDTPRNPAPKGKSEVLGLLDKNFGSSPRKVPTCRFGDAVVWKTKKVPPEIGRNKRKY